MQGFSLKALQHLVLDEADRLLNMDFEQEIDQILKVSVAPAHGWPCHWLDLPAVPWPEVMRSDGLDSLLL